MTSYKAKIYIKHGNDKPIIFSTNKNDLNFISLESMLKLIQWLKEGYGTLGVKCEESKNNKIYILYKENISYVELEKIEK